MASSDRDVVTSAIATRVSSAKHIQTNRRGMMAAMILVTSVPIRRVRGGDGHHLRHYGWIDRSSNLTEDHINGHSGRRHHQDHACNPRAHP
jgi:hypothetical protein